MKQQKILVTGGLGYIGSHTVVALQQSGFEVVIVDDLSNTNISVLEGIEAISGILPTFHQFDICDSLKLVKLFETHHFDGLIHFAAFKAVGESVEQPLAYFQNNIGGLMNVLDRVEQAGDTKFIFSSSCTVYGQAEELPISESSPLQKPESPYGLTKLMGEQIIEELCNNGSVAAIALRYFNPIGAHASSRIGELPTGIPSNLVPFITQTAAGIREELAVFGKDYNTKDGTCIRDYIHVCDLADAHVKALVRLLEGKSKTNFEVFNVGTGNGSTVLELIQSFEKVSGLSLNYTFTDRRPGDIESAFADTTKVNQELGWKAKYGLDEMLSSAWAWQKRLTQNN